MGLHENGRTVHPNAPVIKRLRIEKGWRVEDLAKHAKCSVKTIENAERGANVYFFTLAKLAKELGVEYVALVAGTTPLAESLAAERRFEVQIQLSVPYHDFDEKDLVGLLQVLQRLLKDGVFTWPEPKKAV